MSLQLDCVAHADRTEIRLSGALVNGNTDELRARGRAIGDERPGLPITVFLDQLTDFDRHGMMVLVDLRRHAMDKGSDFKLRVSDQRVVAQFAEANLDGILGIHLAPAPQPAVLPDLGLQPPGL